MTTPDVSTPETLAAQERARADAALEELERLRRGVSQEREQQSRSDGDQRVSGNLNTGSLTDFGVQRVSRNLNTGSLTDFDVLGTARISNPTLAKLGIHDNPANPAVLLSLTYDGHTNPIVELDDRLWTIESFSRAQNDVTVTKRTYGREGYYHRGLGPNPSTIDLVMQYAPTGTTGTPYSWDIRNWYVPLLSLDYIRGINCELRIGGLNYGIWIMKSPKYEHLNLLRIPRGDDVVIVPRITRCNFQFSSVNERIRFDNVAGRVSFSEIPGIG